jgi:hypothetical protein
MTKLKFQRKECKNAKSIPVMASTLFLPLEVSTQGKILLGLKQITFISSKANI